ncbi:MAG TPA: acetate uptake transporter [Acidothermaceae bacterium]
MATAVTTGPPYVAESVAPVANPAPLGLVGFGLTTLLLSVINAGFISAAPGTPTAGSLSVVLATAIAFGGVGQILAGMWEFKVGNTFGATAFTSYGLFWISFVLIETTFGPDLPKDPTPILGMYALGWGIFTAYMFVASLGGASRGVSLVFLLLALTYITLAIAFWGKSLPSAGWNQISGILGLLTAIAAIYCSFAFVTNANFKRTVLPV